MAMGWEDFLSVFISSELSGIWMTQTQAGEPVALLGEPIPVGPFWCNPAVPWPGCLHTPQQGRAAWTCSGFALPALTSQTKAGPGELSRQQQQQL